MLKEAIDRYIALIEGNHFHEAHEEMEYLWRELKASEPSSAKVLKSLINGATTFVLFQKGRDCYPKTWANYQKYRPAIENESEEVRQKFESAEILLQKKIKEFGLVL